MSGRLTACFPVIESVSQGVVSLKEEPSEVMGIVILLEEAVLNRVKAAPADQSLSRDSCFGELTFQVDPEWTFWRIL